MIRHIHDGPTGGFHSERITGNKDQVGGRRGKHTVLGKGRRIENDSMSTLE